MMFIFFNACVNALIMHH